MINCFCTSSLYYSLFLLFVIHEIKDVPNRESWNIDEVYHLFENPMTKSFINVVYNLFSIEGQFYARYNDKQCFKNLNSMDIT